MRCEQGYYIHLDDQCFGIVTTCQQEAGHSMRHGHRAPEISWYFEWECTWNFPFGDCQHVDREFGHYVDTPEDYEGDKYT